MRGDRYKNKKKSEANANANANANDNHTDDQSQNTIERKKKEFTTKHHGKTYQGVNIYLYGFEAERNKTPKQRLVVL